jgi:hypothetical protein
MNSNSHINHGEAVYIIKPQGNARWRVMRYSPKGADEIQGRLAALDDIHNCVVMIYQAYGNTPKLAP